LFDDNIIYNEEQFEAIIDFGDACHYTRAFDLGSVLFGACMADGRLDVTRAAEVMGGYQGQLKLESKERDAVQYFSVYAGAAISAWHYLHTYIRKPLENRLDKYKLAADRTDQLYNLPPEVFDSLLK
jgi:Ser/Thr protein kinase RdoA (MazF antagonist)